MTDNLIFTTFATMLRKRVLIFMILLFGLSQSSGLIISLINHNSSLVSLMIDCEESEQVEKFEFSSDGSIDDFIFNIRFTNKNLKKAFNNTDALFLKHSHFSSPETPPPNAA